MTWLTWTTGLLWADVALLMAAWVVAVGAICVIGRGNGL